MGLIFKCKKCGKCCANVKELIIINKDLKRIKNFLNRDDFYYKIKGRNYIKLKGKKGCIFLKENKCSIYPVRPLVCRSFPLQQDLKRRIWVLNRDPCPGWNIKEYLEEQDYPKKTKDDFVIVMPKPNRYFKTFK